jgi:hypothetical protein
MEMNAQAEKKLSPHPPCGSAPGPQPITVAELRSRFPDLRSNRAARALMRRMRHVARGRDLWTTEEWLAGWLMAESMPGIHPPVRRSLDPLQAAVDERAAAVIVELVRRGILRVAQTPATLNP